MALHYDLPVYKASYDLLIELFKLTKDFSREYKYTVGEKLKNEALELLLNIYKANVSRTKPALLQAGRENIELVRVLLRIIKDLKQISIKRFAQINLKIEDVSKQLTAWMQACR